MKVQTAAVDEIERFGVGVDQAFTINFDAKMARILADGLYSDKVQSVIRELSCNAWDSHVMAGKVDTPFSVHFPTTLEPWFAVQDFGIGLSHTQVLDIYTRYGASTKTNSNEVIGQLGLGSKSPFALTNAFTVVTRKDGKENHYSMYRNEQGMPCVAHLGENPTSEGNGVTVQVPVRAEQRREFMDKAKEVYKWFPVKPNLQGIDRLDIEEFDDVYAGTGWSIIKRKNAGRNDYYYRHTLRPIALMGMVAYPLDANNIHGLREDQRAMLSLPAVLKFDIGDLEVAANREALGYDDRTIENIKAKLEVMLAELGDKFEKLIADAPTEYEARKRFGEIFSYSNEMHHEFSVAFGKRGLHWRGKLIKDSHIKLSPMDVYPLDKDKNRTDAIWISNESWKRPRRSQVSVNENLGIRCDKKTVFFFNDINKGGLTRVHEFNKNNSYAYNIYVFGEHPNVDVARLSKLLLGAEVKLTSSLPRPERAKPEKRTHILQWVYGEIKARAWKQVEIDLSDGGFYVEMDGWDVQSNSGPVNNLTNMVSAMREAGIITADDQIYAMRHKNRDVVRNDPDWKELFAYAKEQTEKEVKSKNLGQLVADANEYRDLTGSANFYVWDNIKYFIDEQSPMALFCNKVLEIKAQINQMTKKTEALRTLAARFDINLSQAAPKHALVAEFKEMCLRYPMLDFLGNRWNTTDADIQKAVDYIYFVDVCMPFYNLNQSE